MNDITSDLKSLNFPKEATIFLAAAKSMYTNIDMELGLSAFRDFQQTNSNKIPADLPVDLFLQILEIALQDKIFKFADTWLQLSGTAMGTPIACACATITFGHYKKTNRLTEFGSILLFYRRYINDIFGTGIPSEETKTTCGIHLKTNSITGVT